MLRKWTFSPLDRVRRAYDSHWAWEPPVAAPLPIAPGFDHPIDAFLHEEMTSAGLTPNPRARPERQLRRLLLDLTGLPPTPDQVEAFLDGSLTWERAVDVALAMPAHGEHLGRVWLTPPLRGHPWSSSRQRTPDVEVPRLGGGFHQSNQPL